MLKTNSLIRSAVIDVGTLKSKFEVREYDKNLKSVVITREKELTVLGRDLDKNEGLIIRRSIESTVEALSRFRNHLKKLKVHKYRAVTTEAIRKAVNSNEVLKEIEDRTGILLETLTHKEEAEIYFHSVSKDFPNQIIAVSDIGGGSIQVVIGKDSEIYETYLFKTGTYFLQEKFSKTHHPTKKELQEAMDYVEVELQDLLKSKYKPRFLIYGSTNIIDFFKAMQIEIKKKQHSSGDHPYAVHVKQLYPLYKRIIELSYEDRMPMYPEEPYYMWAADKALMNIFRISNNLKVSTIVPSNNNISSGILYDLARSVRDGK